MILGPGTIGLLCAMHARARGIEVLFTGVTDESVAFSRSLGLEAYTAESGRSLGLAGAVIDASNDADAPEAAVSLVEPGGRIVYIGLSPGASRVDSRSIAINDLTAVGILSGSPTFGRIVSVFGDGIVDPSILVAQTVGLEAVADVLSGRWMRHSGTGPKTHVDPRL